MRTDKVCSSFFSKYRLPVNWVVFLPAATLFLALTTSAFAAPYTTERLSGDDTYRHHQSQINSGNSVVWVAYVANSYEILLDDGLSVRQLTDDAYSDYDPQINGDNIVVWVKNAYTAESDIYRYAGDTAVKISDNHGWNYDPRINARGEICWWGYDGHDYEIYYYDGLSVAKLTDNDFDDFHPEINDNGQVVWSGNSGNTSEIFLFDGSKTTQITNNNFANSLPAINNNGEIAFIGHDGNDDEIFLYSNNTIRQLTDNDFTDRTVQINDNGVVVWAGSDGNDYEIFQYDDTIIQITNNSLNDYAPAINNNNLVVWDGYSDGSWIRRGIFLYDGKEITVLSIDPSWYVYDYDPQINDNNIVTYWGWSWNGYQIYIAFPLELDVRIDIKPESDNNRTNNKGHEVIPVAIFGSAVLDVAEIKLDSLSLAGLTVKQTGPDGKYLAHYDYVDDDPYLDLVLQFENQKDNFAKETIFVTLTGTMVSGMSIRGGDNISIAPSRNGRKNR